MRYLIIFSFFFSFLTGCQNGEPGRSRRHKPVAVFHDYQVSAEEGRADATIRLQYKAGDENGEAFALEKPSRVLFDGVELPANSSRLSGPYYELIKPVGSLGGHHIILFVDAKGGKHQVEFSFMPFSLATELPEKLGNKPFVLHLDDLPTDPTVLRVVMTDTSLHSAGVNEDVEVKNGDLHVDEGLLKNLSAGPVTMEISREELRPLENLSGQTGRLLLTYTIRRQFELAR